MFEGSSQIMCVYWPDTSVSASASAPKIKYRSFLRYDHRAVVSSFSTAVHAVHIALLSFFHCPNITYTYYVYYVSYKLYNVMTDKNPGNENLSSVTFSKTKKNNLSASNFMNQTLFVKHLLYMYTLLVCFTWSNALQ